MWATNSTIGASRPAQLFLNPILGHVRIVEGVNAEIDHWRASLRIRRTQLHLAEGIDDIGGLGMVGR